MKIRLGVIVLGFFLFFPFGCATLTETGELFRESVQEIKDDRIDFAVINLQSIVKDAPRSPYAPTAMFVLGEYYFDNSDYFNSLKMFSDYIHNYPKHKGIIFAKLIIYKIIAEFKNEEALGSQEDALIKEIRKELFSQPLFLIFYDKKSPRSYKSLFNNSYLVYDYVDKIKVFRNDKIFIELSP
ncbi:MAG: outer membrane protein assembly factor BamD [Candidatus Omnitrophota bacterium]